MLGEVDLCILCETIENHQGQDILELANAELAAWQAKWGGLLQTRMLSPLLAASILLIHLYFKTRESLSISTSISPLSIYIHISSSTSQPENALPKWRLLLPMLSWTTTHAFRLLTRAGYGICLISDLS